MMHTSLTHMQPVSAFTSDGEQKIKALQSRQLHLENATAKLLGRLKQERRKTLEEMRKQVRATMEEWENNPEYLNGLGLKAALFNAEAVAEGFGFDVVRLHKMYLASKKMVLGLEMTGKCGEGSPQLDAIGDTVDSLSKTAKGAMEIFGLAANEEERMACVQTAKLKLYREVNRAYIYALTADSARVSAEGFRRYAGLISNIAGADSAFLADQAIKMAETQDTVMIAFELTPIIGDLIELYRFGTGTEVLGGELDKLDRALSGVFLFTPAVVEQLFKRYPKIFLSMKSFIKELVYPAGGFFDSAAIRAGQELAPLKKKAGEIWDKMLGLEKELAKHIGGRVRDVVGESIEAIWRRMEHLPGGNLTRRASIQASNMIAPHVDALREVAMARGEILMFRPFNSHGKAAMEQAVEEAKQNGTRIATKWMDVKPKSAGNPILGAAIPINPRLSKFDNQLKEALENGDLEEFARIEEKIEEMRGKVTALFRKRDAKGNPLVKGTPAIYEGQNVRWATRDDGEVVMGIWNEAGDLIDPITRASFGIVDPQKAKKIMIITDPNASIILPDYDMFAVGSKAKAHDKVIAKKGEDYTLKGNRTGTHTARGGEIVEEESVFAGSLGGLSRANLDTMTDINYTIAAHTGVKGDLVHHGPANFWEDIPDYPITVYMPDGNVKTISEGVNGDIHEACKEFYHVLKQEGYSGFDPHPNWGWPDYNPRHGYRTPEEILRITEAAAR
ncbi:MAG: hypothetical protein JKY34_00345 [Kordiimonadaceae bacterium]|nr:hypothetical protein [Kordiimonadaceae bacterium]